MKLFGLNIPNELITSLFTFLIALLFLFVIKSIFNKLIKTNNIKSKHEQRRKETLLKLFYRIIKYITLVIVVLSILTTYHINTTALVTSVGALSVVIGLAFQDVLKDFLVGVSIVFEDQFSIGDFVEINGYKGDIVGFNLKSTRIRAITGETTIISNRQISEVTNYSFNKTKMFVDVSVSYEDNNEKVENVLKDICLNLNNNIKEIEEIRLCDGIEELSNSSVNYRIEVILSIRNIYFVKRMILKNVKETFDNKNIKIPYPQIEVHNER